MCIAIAIYGIDNIDPELAFDIGFSFFKIVGFDVNVAGYYDYKGDEGDVEFVEVSLVELKDKIIEKEVTSFRLYSNSKKNKYWDVSFGYSTKDFGGFYHFDAQCVQGKEVKEKYIEFIRVLSCRAPFSYGVVYRNESVIDGFYYSEGGNFVQVYQYEDPVLFEMETGGVYEGRERYNETMLRMVYPINVVNESHLAIDVNGFSLREWILSGEERGWLEKLNNEMWLWEVPEKNLDEVNALLGEVGVLISWKLPLVKKVSRKLP
ncbi:hypothetical protein C5E04_21755 [Pectobacterium parmentieri]|uniref:hypothetical protein n=1 Tax=Pectobacterium parmentieri TaxID=1905730 RepID=UPI000EB3C206|nr:hypothetical protein [Pectobacterium parmentieri]RKO74912.1 hypothetical protein C5E04_21755 [Pectobacterium parmentieri]